MCWDCNNNPKGDPHKNYVRGGVEIDDFDKEVNYQTRLKGRSGNLRYKKEKPRPGCPENNYGPHVYVWTTEFEEEDLFSKHYGYHKREREFCAGCGKNRYRSRVTERYEKVRKRKYEKMYGDGTNVPRGTPRPRRRADYKPTYKYWAWEKYDEAFVAKVEAHNAKHHDWKDKYYISGYLWA